MARWDLIMTFVGLLCSHISGVFMATEEPVALTVLDDSNLQQSPTTKDGLPQEVDIALNVLGKPVSLKLERNKKISGERFFSIQKSDAGVPVLVRQNIPLDTLFGEYQDSNNTACFTLTCDNNDVNNGKNCTPTWEGSFVTDTVKYELRVMDDTSIHRTKREAKHLWAMVKNIVSMATSSSKVYGIYKNVPTMGTSGDFTDPFREDLKPRSAASAAALTGELRTVREDIIPGRQNYNVEVLAVIDYPIYERFYKSSKGQTPKERALQAKSKIRKYFSHVFNGIDLLYRGIDSLGISVGVTGFVIADTEEASEFTSSLKEKVVGGLDQILAKSALESVINWSFRARNLPKRDHLMLFTGYDVYSSHGGVKENNTAGYARIGAMCDFDSVSMVEEHAGYQSIHTGTHELGHSLGARHDGFSNPCDQYDQHIMAAHGGFASGNTKINPWKFSSCSVQYFKNFLNRLPRRSCLSDPLDVFDLDKFVEYVSSYPGQEVTPNEQCQDVLGLDSYYGWGSNLGNYGEICTEMACSMPNVQGRYRVIKAVTGTSCGDKKWCINGRCEFSPNAPTRPDTCVHGDSLRLFKGKSCAQYIIEFPGRCYNTYLKSRCCGTCDKLHTGTAECEFGDKFKNCDARLCSVPRYAKNCCSTCGIAPHPVSMETDTNNSKSNIKNSFMERTTKPTTTRKPTTQRTTIKTTTKRNNVWWQPPRQPTNWRPVTRRPVTRRPTTRRPRPTTTTRRTEMGTNQEPCLKLKDSGTFLLLFRCSAVARIFGDNVCQRSMVKDSCCEPCTKNVQSTSIINQIECKDKPTCTAKVPSDCYVPSVRSKCCQTCNRFKTDIPGCPYGNRLKTCQKFVESLGITRVCEAYKHYCCQSCAHDTGVATPTVFKAVLNRLETVRDPVDTSRQSKDTMWINQKIQKRKNDINPSSSLSSNNKETFIKKNKIKTTPKPSTKKRRFRITFSNPSLTRRRFPVAFRVFRW